MEQTIPVVDLNDFHSKDIERRQAFISILGDALVEYGLART